MPHEKTLANGEGKKNFLSSFREELKAKSVNFWILIFALTVAFIFVSVAYGGTTTTDTFGTSSIYAKLIAASQDKVVVGIVALFLAVLGFASMVKGMVLTGFFLWGLGIGFSKLEPIVDAITSGTLPL